MTAPGVVLLGAGVAGAVTRPGRVPAWVPPATAVLAAGATGVVDVALARRSLDPLVDPLAFLLLAVPLAVMLDQLGVFESLAALAARRRRVIAGMWLLCTATTALLNLDAAVVLLTPLAIRIAKRCDIDPLVLAVQPVLLACLASSFLPVSNLTNLIADARFGLGPGAFLTRLGPPSGVGLIVGWWCYRRAYAPGSVPAVGDSPSVVDTSSLRTAAVVSGVLLLGFLAGPVVSIAPWMVVASVDVALAVRLRRVPLAAVPWGTAAVAAALAILAGAAVEHVALGRLLDGSGPVATARVALLGAAAANVINNLPALLVGVARLPHGSPLVWPLLLGVNVGPTLLVTGSLASLLWLDALRRDGLHVGALDYARLGLRAGVPALVVSTAVLAASTVGWVGTLVAVPAVLVSARVVTRVRDG